MCDEAQADKDPERPYQVPLCQTLLSGGVGVGSGGGAPETAAGTVASCTLNGLRR